MSDDNVTLNGKKTSFFSITMSMSKDLLKHGACILLQAPWLKCLTCKIERNGIYKLQPSQVRVHNKTPIPSVTY